MENYSCHYATKNTSFIDTAVELKALGIKNYMFFLRLYDPALSNVNPHDPTLTDDIKLRIMNECIRNPWYYLRECVKFPAAGLVGDGVPFELHRGNLATIFCTLNNINHYSIFSSHNLRRASYLAMMSWFVSFGTVNTSIAYIDQTFEDAANNVSRTKDIIDLLPAFMQKSFSEFPGNLVNPLMANNIRSKAAPQDVHGAENYGRSIVEPIQFFNEIEHTNFNKILLAASAPSYYSAAKNAERNKSFHCRIISTSIGDPQSQLSNDMLELIRDCAVWQESLYDVTLESINLHLDNASTQNMFYIEYRYDQMRKDQTWYENMCKMYFNDDLKIDRELHLKRTYNLRLS